MSSAVKTVLMFVGEQSGHAHDAVQLYASVFPDVRLGEVTDLGRDQCRCDFSIGAASFIAFDSDGPHDFSFTPATSIWVELASVEDLTLAASTLAEGGRVLMEIGDYGFSPAFTWLDDRFGVSWQLSVPPPQS